MKTNALTAWLLLLSGAVFAQTYKTIVIGENAHPAAVSAATIIAQKLGLAAEAVQVSSDVTPSSGQLVLKVSPLKNVTHDGYRVVFEKGGAVICGNRPRSLLYAAGDLHHWKDKTAGTYTRQPSFGVRSVEHHGSMPMGEYVAATGLNLLIDRRARASVTFRETLPEVFAELSDEQRDRMDRRQNESRENPTLRACHDADVDYYVFLYGNNMQLWSDPLYRAALKAHPSVKGTPAANSWERATLCPSDPMTWKLIDAYLREYLLSTQADGLYVTFWDNYGIYCQCDRCRASGMHTFANQLHACVKQYHKTASSLGKKLVVRTWSSGVPHWLVDQWVHAPGYDHFGGSGEQLWGRVFKELPADIIIQTKVYHADCQPDPPFSPLIGKAAPHTEIAEYQMTGQTTGRYYFPASTVRHTARTMKKARQLIGPSAGVNLFLGGTRRTEYFLLDDILNSVNVWAWRELSWNVEADPTEIVNQWAEQVYGPKAAPYVAEIMDLSEDAVNKTFSTLGMGSSTNSDFAKTIARRETLLMYTNRHFLPAFASNLEPTRENIQRVIDEKEKCLADIDQMLTLLEEARPHLTEAQARELATRLDWLKQFASAKRWLEEGLFRFRYLRFLNSMRTTDPGQMMYLARCYDQVIEYNKRLFRYDPDQKFNCCSRPLGQLTRPPSLGSAVPLIRDIYGRSKTYVEEIVGPHDLPQSWRR